MGSPRCWAVEDVSDHHLVADLVVGDGIDRDLADVRQALQDSLDRGGGSASEISAEASAAASARCSRQVQVRSP